MNLALFALAFPLFASTITSSVTCEVGGVRIATVSATAPSHCSVDVADGIWTAHASASVIGGPTNVSMSLIAHTVANDTSVGAIASVSFSAMASIFTAGPPRQGWVDLTFSGGGGCLDCGVSTSTSFDQYKGEWGGHYGQCNALYCQGTFTFSTMLGEAHEVTTTANSTGYGGPGGYQSSATGHASLGIQFRELDGTPVAWGEVMGDVQHMPEPATWWMGLVGLGLLARSRIR